MVYSAAKLTDPLIVLHATFCQSDHRVIKMFNVVRKFLDAPGQRTNHSFQTSQALVMLGLVAKQEFNGFLYVHVFTLPLALIGTF